MQNTFNRFFPGLVRFFKESNFFKEPSAYVPILTAFILPILIGLLNPMFFRTFFGVVVLFAFMLPVAIVVLIIWDWWINNERFLTSVWKYLRPLPPGYVFGTDLKRDSFPWVTASLIFVNVIVFLSQTRAIENWGMFLPYVKDAGALHKMASFFTCAFLHGNIYHLGGNMIFLWVFGATLEPRVGHLRFGLLYLAGIVASNFFVLVLLLIQAFLNPENPLIRNYHSLGASGAIAGVMGVFVVRCFFARVSVSFPVLLLPFLSMPLRVQATVLLGLFFAMDMGGGVRMFSDTGIRVGYWAHVGGYLGGFVIGYLMGLHRDAARESIRVKAERCTKKMNREHESLELYEQIYQEEPDNEAALEYLFKRNMAVSEAKAGAYYGPLMDIRMGADFKKALELVDFYYPKFVRYLSGAALYRIGSHYLSNGELVKARVFLDFGADKESPWQAKSMMLLGDAFEFMGSVDRARQVFRQVAERFPQSPFEQAALARIREMGEGGEEE